MVFKILQTGLSGMLFGLLAAALIGSSSSMIGCTSKPVRATASSESKAKLPSLEDVGDDEDDAPDSSTTAAKEMSAQEAAERPYPSKSTQLSFDWPVNEARLTRGFLPKKKRRPHLGIDLAATKGTPILSAHEGTVIYTGRAFRGYGKMIMIEGKEGFATLYAHLSKISVQEGQKVAQGDPIGQMGRTGRATGTHLHFEVRTDKGPVDPLNYLPTAAFVAKYILEGKKKAASY